MLLSNLNTTIVANHLQTQYAHDSYRDSHIEYGVCGPAEVPGPGDVSCSHAMCAIWPEAY